jgi:hypothetical protein
MKLCEISAPNFYKDFDNLPAFIQYVESQDDLTWDTEDFQGRTYYVARSKIETPKRQVVGVWIPTNKWGFIGVPYTWASTGITNRAGDESPHAAIRLYNAVKASANG